MTRSPSSPWVQESFLCFSKTIYDGWVSLQYKKIFIHCFCCQIEIWKYSDKVWAQDIGSIFKMVFHLDAAFFSPHVHLWVYFLVSVYESHTEGKQCPTLSVWNVAPKWNMRLLLQQDWFRWFAPYSLYQRKHKTRNTCRDAERINAIISKTIAKTSTQEYKNLKHTHGERVREGFCPVSTSCSPPSQRQGVTLPRALSFFCRATQTTCCQQSGFPQKGPLLNFSYTEEKEGNALMQP